MNNNTLPQPTKPPQVLSGLRRVRMLRVLSMLNCNCTSGCMDCSDWTHPGKDTFQRYAQVWDMSPKQAEQAFNDILNEGLAEALPPYFDLKLTGKGQEVFELEITNDVGQLGHPRWTKRGDHEL